MPNTQPAGYLALPASEQGGGVLVLHAWWGLNDTMKEFCERLAESGFVAFAPDLYHGELAQTIAEAETLRDSLDIDRARAEITDSVRFLRERAGGVGDGLTVIGFSLGAFFALELSVSNPKDIRSVVVFYGTRPGDYAGSKAAYLGHFAESDEFEPQSDVDNLEAALRQAGCAVEFHMYTGTGHWFFERDRSQAFNAEAAASAWERTLKFLKRPSTS